MKAVLKKEKSGREYEYKTIRVNVPKGWRVCNRWVQNKVCAPAFDIDVLTKVIETRLNGGQKKAWAVCSYGGYDYREGTHVTIRIRKKKMQAKVLEAL